MGLHWGLRVVPNEDFLRSLPERNKKALYAKITQASEATARLGSDMPKNSLFVQTTQLLSRRRKEAQPVVICILAEFLFRSNSVSIRQKTRPH